MHTPEGEVPVMTEVLEQAGAEVAKPAPPAGRLPRTPLPFI